MLVFVFFLVNGVVQNGWYFVQWLFAKQVRYAVGQQVQLEWELGQSIGNGLLEFKQANEKSWWVKSKVIDLTRYAGKTIVQWIIVDSTADERYIVDVARVYQIIDSSKPNLLTKYYDIWLWLYLDVSDDENYFLDTDEQQNIFVKDIRIFRPTMKITQFRCDDKQSDTDCVGIIQTAEKQWTYDTFISLNGLRYVKVAEGKRFVDDKQGRGYHIAVSNDKAMYYLSRFVFLLDKQYISWKIYDRLDTICKDNELTMAIPESFELKTLNNNWFAIIKGKTAAWASVQCELFLDDSSKQNLNIQLANMLPL